MSRFQGIRANTKPKIHMPEVELWSPCEKLKFIYIIPIKFQRSIKPFNLCRFQKNCFCYYNFPE